MKTPRFAGVHVAVAVMSLIVAVVGAALALGYEPDGSDATGDRIVAPVALSTPTGTAAKGYLVVAVGDIACKPGLEVTDVQCHHAQVADRVAAIDPRRLLLLGDIQYDFATTDEFAAVFDKTWRRFRGISKPVPGNHEYFTPAAKGYYDYFGVRANPPDGYYSFDVGGWHFVALNSNCSIVSCAYGSAQERWLRRDLRRSDRRCVGAFWHHARFSSGDHGSDQALSPLWRVLDRERATLVLSGHDHDYERFDPQNADAVARRHGPRQFVVGTGGRHFYPIKSKQPNSARFIESEFGVLELRLRARAYSWRFVNQEGVTLDKGTASCAPRRLR